MNSKIPMGLILAPLALAISMAWMHSESHPQIWLDANTDKQAYLELEELSLNLAISLNRELDASLTITGIKTRFGRYYINAQHSIHLSPGLNQLQLKYRIPACTACSGVDPGEHQILIQLHSGEQLLSSKTLTIQIQRRS